jgi:hypothetical protein
MTLSRPSRITAWIAGAACCLLVVPYSAGAQSFVELGAGWNYYAPAAQPESYRQTYNIRASIGQQISPRVLIRFDALVNQFQQQVFRGGEPCPFASCAPQYISQVGGITALTANALVNVDERGIFYISGGSGIYDTNANSDPAKVSIGVSAAIGITVPVGVRLRAFLEARDHIMLASGSQPPWFVPITFGLRF